MGVLDAIDGWPVGAAAAGVTAADGFVDLHGPVAAPFPLASVTKPLTALAVLVAVEEGTVELDEPAGPPGSTVRHLLAHASGLATDGLEVLAAPGERRIYSNTGFEALGAFVAERAAMTFATYLDEAVLQPLGMAATRLDGSPAHGATGTVADLLRLGRELLAPTLVAPATLDGARAPAFPGLVGVLPGFGRQDPNDWGLGFELRDHKSPHWTGAGNSPATFGHFGRSGSFLWVDPDAGLACASLSDREFGPWAAAAWPALSDAVLAAHARRGPGAPADRAE
jgi:CubicO group peptidase (beta-lactamase class C family)